MYEQRPKMNCEWLNEQNMYDLLIRIQERLDKHHMCILEILDDGYGLLCLSTQSIAVHDCKTCIQQWMTRRRGT